MATRQRSGPRPRITKPGSPGATDRDTGEAPLRATPDGPTARPAPDVETADRRTAERRNARRPVTMRQDDETTRRQTSRRAHDRCDRTTKGPRDDGPRLETRPL